MKKITLLLSAVVLVGSAFTISTIWNVAKQGVLIEFSLPGEGTKGSLSGFKASIDFDRNDPSTAKISGSIDIKTLNTGNPQKDKHLMSPDFFDAEKYPEASFESVSVKATADGFVAAGNLKLKDVTQAVEIPFTFVEENGAGAFKGILNIQPCDFGVMKKRNNDTDKAVITLTIPVNK